MAYSEGLISLAVDLALVGEQVELARIAMTRLADKGYSLSSPEMLEEMCIRDRSVGSLTVEQLKLQLGKDVLLQLALVRVKTGHGPDEPDGKLLVDIVVIPVSYTHLSLLFCVLKPKNEFIQFFPRVPAFYELSGARANVGTVKFNYHMRPF